VHQVGFVHDQSQRVGCGRSLGALLRGSGASVRAYGPGGAATLAEVTATTWQDSTGPACP
jgi:hypothetical protein